MPKYVMFFSYIGTGFRGSQRLLNADKTLDLKSVQALLEYTLGTIWRGQHPAIRLSSRTDAGVHAFINTADFDTESWQPQCNLQPHEITKILNRLLRSEEIRDVSILKICPVPDGFHCRWSVKHRSYMYRLAMVRDDIDTSHCNAFRYQPLLPMVEQLRCHVVGPDFNVDAFCATMKLFKGVHNFSKFMANPTRCPPYVSPIKRIDLHIVPGQPFLHPSYDPLYENVDFHEVHLQSRSFLHKQIRRMIGAGIEVGYGRIHIDEVKYMLNNPDAGDWRKNTRSAPPYGLYLTNILYDALDLEFPRNADEDNKQSDEDSS